jgi:hypothetical protein
VVLLGSKLRSKLSQASLLACEMHQESHQCKGAANQGAAELWSLYLSRWWISLFHSGALAEEIWELWLSHPLLVSPLTY